MVDSANAEWEKQFIPVSPKVTVYLLGAGASNASSYKLPLMRGFFGNDKEAIPSELLGFLKEFYDGVRINNWNIEEVMTYLHFRQATAQPLTSSPLAEPEVRFTGAYTQLLQFIWKRLKLPNESPECKLHKMLLERLRPRDTILTLNYDLLMDLSLAEAEKRAEEGLVGEQKAFYQPTGRLASLSLLLGQPLSLVSGEVAMSLDPEEYLGYYLKLHGSLDWVYCPREGCANNHRFIIQSLSRVAAEPGRPCVICGAPLAIYVVPPIAAKDFTNARKLNFLWQIALEELRRAERIVCIGVSFAPSDTHLRWLIREALLTRTNNERLMLTIVNPDAQVTSQLFGYASKEDAMKSGRVKCYESMEDYLKATS
ncbi:MAG: hypothetical protein HY286_02070 [Planctomycetes bacterium]|nr:hypothetical protein [Planctomycetota bacterium]